jgi:hypothetical protein
MEELRKVQRDYGAAFANVLRLAKQHGLDCPTAEWLLHAPTRGLRPVLIPVPVDVDLRDALQRAALAFQQLIDAVHPVYIMPSACLTSSSDTLSGEQTHATDVMDDGIVGLTLADDTVVVQVEMSDAAASKEG